jgi:hypothetical protein
MTSKSSGYAGVDMSVISTKREKEPKNTSSDLPKPYPANAPADLHKKYYEKYVAPKITGSKTIDATLFKYAKRAEAAGVKLPKMLQGKTFKEYLASQGMEQKKRGGTNLNSRPKMMRGGVSGGKPHMYAAGGVVKDNPGLRALKAASPTAYNKITGK